MKTKSSSDTSQESRKVAAEKGRGPFWGEGRGVGGGDVKGGDVEGGVKREVRR